MKQAGLHTLWAIGVVGAAIALGAAGARAQEAGPAGEPLGRPIGEWDGPIEVPVSYTEGRILVPVTLDGVGERLFILDTAAGGSVISSALRDLVDPGAGEARQDTVIGASGSTVMEFVSLAGLHVGGRHHADVWAVVADISPFREYDGRRVDGILGVDVLRAYDLEIDLPGDMLRLHPHGATAPAWTAGRQAIPFHSSAQPGFIQFEAAVAGSAVDAILDTGARETIVNWHAAALAGLGPESGELREDSAGSRGIDGKGMPSHRGSLAGLAVGDVPVPDREQRIADLPVFRAMGLDGGPVLLLGASLLEPCAIWISYSAGTFHLCRTGPSPEPGPGDGDEADFPQPAVENPGSAVDRSVENPRFSVN